MLLLILTREIKSVLQILHVQKNHYVLYFRTYPEILFDEGEWNVSLLLHLAAHTLDWLGHCHVPHWVVLVTDIRRDNLIDTAWDVCEFRLWRWLWWGSRQSAFLSNGQAMHAIILILTSLS